MINLHYINLYVSTSSISNDKFDLRKFLSVSTSSIRNDKFDLCKFLSVSTSSIRNDKFDLCKFLCMSTFSISNDKFALYNKKIKEIKKRGKRSLLLLPERKVCLYFQKNKNNQFPQSNLFQEK